MRHLINTGLTLILIFAIGVLHAQTTTAPPKPPAPIAIDGISQGGGWRLPETHFVSAKMPMRLVHPRSMPGNDETATWARHKYAYPGLEYRIPVSIQGGAYPFHYEIVSGPGWLSIGQQYGGDEYGVLSGIAPATPQAAETVVLRVTDQELTVIDIEFPLTVTTDGFIFVDASVARSGDGTIGSPLKRFAELHGDYYPGSGSLGNAGTTAYGGKRVYLRGGVHQVADIPTPYISWSGRPQVILGYPGENVELQHTNGQIRSLGADFFFSGITSRYGPNLNLVEGGHWSEVDGQTPHTSNSWLYAYDNSWNMENANRIFALGGGDRPTVFEWTVLEHRGGFNNTHTSLRSGGNEGAIFSSARGAGSYRDYVTVYGARVQDLGRSLIHLYGTRYGVAENNVVLPDSGGPYTTTATAVLYLKEQNTFWSVRRNTSAEHALNLSGGGGLYLSAQNRNGHTDSVLIEAAYNLVVSVGNDRGRAFNFNQAGLAVEDYAEGHQVWGYRNTLIGSLRGGDRPYTVTFENNVLMLGEGSNTSGYPAGGYPLSGNHRVVVVGEVGIIDSPANWQTYLDADYKLKGTYREQYLGKVGHEISGSV